MSFFLSSSLFVYFFKILSPEERLIGNAASIFVKKRRTIQIDRGILVETARYPMYSDRTDDYRSVSVAARHARQDV